LKIIPLIILTVVPGVLTLLLLLPGTTPNWDFGGVHKEEVLFGTPMDHRWFSVSFLIHLWTMRRRDSLRTL
jgi:hypothetical protein